MGWRFSKWPMSCRRLVVRISLLIELRMKRYPDIIKVSKERKQHRYLTKRKHLHLTRAKAWGTPLASSSCQIIWLKRSSSDSMIWIKLKQISRGKTTIRIYSYKMMMEMIKLICWRPNWPLTFWMKQQANCLQQMMLLMWGILPQIVT